MAEEREAFIEVTGALLDGDEGKVQARIVAFGPVPIREMEAYLANLRLFCRGNHSPELLTEEVDRGIKAIFRSGHLGIFEHAYATVKINCSRVTSHQIVRHRLFSFVQQSQRAMNQEDNRCFIPDEAGAMLFTMGERNLISNVINQYGNLIRTGSISKEDARYILPHGMMTTLVMTGNFRNWLHFLRLRLHKTAQGEIRHLAEQIQSQFEDCFPRIFSRKAIASMTYAPELEV